MAYLHTESFQEIKEIQKHLISLKRGRERPINMHKFSKTR